MLVYVRSGLDVRLLELTGSCRSSGAGPPLQDWLSLSIYILYYCNILYIYYNVPGDQHYADRGVGIRLSDL